MKKILLFSFAIATALSTYAQKERLLSINANDGEESDSFFYNEQGLLDYRYHEESWVDGFTFKDCCTYNDKGQLVTLKTYQDVYGDPNNMVLVCKLEYAYNDNGQLITRDNYNTFDLINLEHSARITYEYNEEGKKVKETTYWASNLSKEFMHIDYEYDLMGRLSKAVEYQRDLYYNTFPCIGYQAYSYNNKGLLANSCYYAVDEYENEYLNSVTQYSYVGNDLVMTELKASNGDIHSRLEFEYDMTVPATDVYLPKTHEFEIESSFNIAHKRLLEKVWMMNDYANTLEYTHDRVYNYEDNPCGIQSIVANDSNHLIYDANARSLHLNGNTTVEVRVVDMQGQQVLKTTACGQVDLSNLPTGSYVVSTRALGQPLNSTKLFVK